MNDLLYQMSNTKFLVSCLILFSESKFVFVQLLMIFCFFFRTLSRMVKPRFAKYLMICTKPCNNHSATSRIKLTNQVTLSLVIWHRLSSCSHAYFFLQLIMILEVCSFSFPSLSLTCSSFFVFGTHFTRDLY